MLWYAIKIGHQLALLRAPDMVFVLPYCARPIRTVALLLGLSGLVVLGPAVNASLRPVSAPPVANRVATLFAVPRTIGGRYDGRGGRRSWAG